MTNKKHECDCATCEDRNDTMKYAIGGLRYLNKLMYEVGTGKEFIYDMAQAYVKQIADDLELNTDREEVQP